VIEGRVAIPTKAVMAADTLKWQEREDNMGGDHKVHHRLQYEHTEAASKLGGGHLRDDAVRNLGFAAFSVSSFWALGV
jgi:hypothetical protein